MAPAVRVIGLMSFTNIQRTGSLPDVGVIPLFRGNLKMSYKGAHLVYARFNSMADTAYAGALSSF